MERENVPEKNQNIPDKNKGKTRNRKCKETKKKKLPENAVRGVRGTAVKHITKSLNKLV